MSFRYILKNNLERCGYWVLENLARHKLYGPISRIGAGGDIKMNLTGVRYDDVRNGTQIRKVGLVSKSTAS
jgi:hypothetical protein